MRKLTWCMRNKDGYIWMGMAWVGWSLVNTVIITIKIFIKIMVYILCRLSVMPTIGGGVIYL